MHYVASSARCARTCSEWHRGLQILAREVLRTFWARLGIFTVFCVPKGGSSAQCVCCTCGCSFASLSGVYIPGWAGDEEPFCSGIMALASIVYCKGSGLALLGGGHQWWLRGVSRNCRMLDIGEKEQQPLYGRQLVSQLGILRGLDLSATDMNRKAFFWLCRGCC